MVGTLVIEFQLPYRELSSNARLGWREKSAYTAQYRQDCAVIAREAMRAQQWLPVASQVRMDLLCGIKGGRKVQRYQPRDEANALHATKAAIDSLVSAGVIKDDSRRFLTIGSVRITAEDGPWVRVNLTQV